MGGSLQPRPPASPPAGNTIPQLSKQKLTFSHFSKLTPKKCNRVDRESTVALSIKKSNSRFWSESAQSSINLTLFINLAVVSSMRSVPASVWSGEVLFWYCYSDDATPTTVRGGLTAARVGGSTPARRPTRAALACP